MPPSNAEASSTRRPEQGLRRRYGRVGVAARGHPKKLDDGETYGGHRGALFGRTPRTIHRVARATAASATRVVVRNLLARRVARSTQAAGRAPPPSHVPPT